MDLISIRRTYRNKSNLIIGMFIFVLITVFALICSEKIEITKRKKEYNNLMSYKKRVDEQVIEIAKKEEYEEKMRKLPNLTQVGRDNMENIFHSDYKRAFLTFDDGPSRTVTPQILDVLKNENVKATFFVLGNRIKNSPEIIKRQYDEGHFVANHGYTHKYSKIYVSPQSTLDEYNMCNDEIRKAINQPTYDPHLFRFPGGAKGGKYAAIKKEASILLDKNNILNIDWNALTSDSAGAKTTEEFLSELDKTVPHRNSVVVLMHDKKATLEALPQIIKYFRDKGFEFHNFYDIIK